MLLPSILSFLSHKEGKHAISSSRLYHASCGSACKCQVRIFMHHSLDLLTYYGVVVLTTTTLALLIIPAWHLSRNSLAYVMLAPLPISLTCYLLSLFFQLMKYSLPSTSAIGINSKEMHLLSSINLAPESITRRIQI